jgi:hypothetical protein
MDPKELDKIEWDHSQPVETHELTQAEVEKIHAKGSPHQHLDPTPHPEPLNYSGQQAKQTIEAARSKRDAIKAEVGQKLKDALPGQVIPRYLRRAVWSKNPFKIYKAVTRAESEGWTRKEMKKQVRQINEHQAQTKEYEVQENN